MATRHGSAVVTLPTDTQILITRSFEAPRDRVWEALTTPALLLRWWGPEWCPLISCDVDLRVGGSWRYVSKMDDGTELGWHGVYREIVTGERIVSTEVFEGFPDAESVNTMTLTEAGGVTTLQTLVQHSSVENRNGHIESGMEGGMQDTFNRLDDLLAPAAPTNSDSPADPASPAERFRRVAARFSEVAAAARPGDWDRPAPCDGWVARDVVRHMVEWMPSMLRGADITLTAGPSVDDDPAGAWQHLADSLQALLDDPETAGREFDAGPPGRMTVSGIIGMIMLGDVFLHTWDLARAIGVDDTLDPAIVAEMYDGMQPMDEMLRASGHYGPKVDVPADADTQTRLIAFVGRNPGFGRV